MKGNTLLCMALVTLMLLSVFMIGRVGAQPATVGVEPQGVVDLGLVATSTFTVEVWVRNIVDVAGVEFKLGYDTSVLTATNIAWGGLFGDNYFPLKNRINDTIGYCWYALMEHEDDPGFTGDAKVCIITFTVDALGESDLHLYDRKIGDSSVPPWPIAHKPLDGYFSNVHLWLHSEGGLIDLENPVGTDWHELAPTFSNTYEITGWPDDSDGSGNLTVCDNINLKNKTTQQVAKYGVDAVTVTLNVTHGQYENATNSPGSSIAGGAWTNPDNAHTSDNTYARATDDGQEQQYGSYGFSIPSGWTIVGVYVGFEAYTTSDEAINITCSWGAGAAGTWAPEYYSDELPAADPNTVTWVEFTGFTSWNPTKLNDANFRTKVESVQVGGGSYTDAWLDWIPVTVIYTVGEVTSAPHSPSSSIAGTWSDPDNAWSSDNTYATSATTGAEHQWGSYGFNIPSGSAIARVEVGVEAHNTGDDWIGIACSWNTGGDWATVVELNPLSQTDTNSTWWVDFTTATGWTATKLNDANFRTKAKYYDTGGNTATNLDWIPARVTYVTSYFVYIEFRGNIGDFNWANPVTTRWHGIYPVFSHNYSLTSFTDNGASGLNAGDVIRLENETTEVEYPYPVNEVSTDIKVTKIAHTTPEFPLGSVLPIALIIVVIYVWWISKRKRITRQQKRARATTPTISHSR